MMHGELLIVVGSTRRTPASAFPFCVLSPKFLEFMSIRCGDVVYMYEQHEIRLNIEETEATSRVLGLARM